MMSMEENDNTNKDYTFLSRKRSRVEDDNQQLSEGDSALSRVHDSNLPQELQQVDFSERIAWGKYSPYTNVVLPLVPPEAAPCFNQTSSPALCHYVNAISFRARACTIHLKPSTGQGRARPIPTPMFMPVGTKGCLKGVTIEELTSDPALACPIILGNTYHLAIQPGTELIDRMGGLHAFQGLKDRAEHVYNILTDSGGFQMVSLVKLSQVTEEGVIFENPFKTRQSNVSPTWMNKKDDQQSHTNPLTPNNDMLLLRPEDSIRHQNNIGANIIMALDDVVSSASEDRDRFRTATYRTLRWYDRCYQAHAKIETQNLFPIVQGGLDIALGGLREQCLAGFRLREQELNYTIPGFAIGGLAGGESKDDFWRVIDQCCRALPDNKPRYLMGVGYPLDVVVCTALGVDLYDCVYPTRTARFGVALVPGRAPGTLRLKGHEFSFDDSVLQKGCGCQACRNAISRSRLHVLFKAGNPLAVQLITQHNLAYMMSLVRTMRESIVEGKFAEFVQRFVAEQYPGNDQGGEAIPTWVVDALLSAGIVLPGVVGNIATTSEAEHDRINKNQSLFVTCADS